MTASTPPVRLPPVIVATKLLIQSKGPALDQRYASLILHETSIPHERLLIITHGRLVADAKPGDSTTILIFLVHGIWYEKKMRRQLRASDDMRANNFHEICYFKQRCPLIIWVVPEKWPNQTSRALSHFICPCNYIEDIHEDGKRGDASEDVEKRWWVLRWQEGQW